MVLTTTMSDLDRPHHRRQTTDLLPVPAGGNTVEQARTVGVTTTRGVDDGLGLNTGNLMTTTVGKNARACAPKGHDQCLHLGRKLLK